MGDRRVTQTYTTPTPGKGMIWNREKWQELINQLAWAEEENGGTLTIAYESDAEVPTDD